MGGIIYYWKNTKGWLHCGFQYWEGDQLFFLLYTLDKRKLAWISATKTYTELSDQRGGYRISFAKEPDSGTQPCVWNNSSTACLECMGGMCWVIEASPHPQILKLEPNPTAYSRPVFLWLTFTLGSGKVVIWPGWPNIHGDTCYLSQQQEMLLFVSFITPPNSPRLQKKDDSKIQCWGALLYSPNKFPLTVCWHKLRTAPHINTLLQLELNYK